MKFPFRHPHHAHLEGTSNFKTTASVWLLFTLFLAIGAASGEVAAFGWARTLKDSPPIHAWNQVALHIISQERVSPPMASRALALLHTSILQATMHADVTKELKSAEANKDARLNAVISSVSRSILLLEFPKQKVLIDDAFTEITKNIQTDPAVGPLIRFGDAFGRARQKDRQNDGSKIVSVPKTESGIGKWVATGPKFTAPLLPSWQNVRLFVLPSVDNFRAPKAPEITSATYAFDYQLTKDIGAKGSTSRTLEQTTIAHFWEDGPGTNTPPGHWNVIARGVSIDRKVSETEAVRLYAMLNAALADAAVVCWDCKYSCNFWRPITAIHHADNDNNPSTMVDPKWEPLLPTPPFPEYTSGHSTFSGTAAAVLARFFGTDDVQFESRSQSLPGFVREYPSFSAAAVEAGMSRIYGGIHFMSANTQGLNVGNRIGNYAFENWESLINIPTGPQSQAISLLDSAN